MIDNQFKIGKIVRIEGIRISIAIDNDIQINKIELNSIIKDYSLSIQKYIYTFLPNQKRIIGRINKVYERSFENEDLFKNHNSNYVAEATLTAIYDDYQAKLDKGINTFPIIDSEIFVLTQDLYKCFYKPNSTYNLEIGNSFVDENLPIFANPDVLLGKHLGIFGNTGTGKSCTVASVIQGLKRRLLNSEFQKIEVSPKIIIFDANDEYRDAFAKEGEFDVKYIAKKELKLPHYHLSISEYIKLFGASQGVQAPVLKEAITKLKDNNEEFSISEIPDAIVGIVEEKSNGNNYNYSQWYGWCSTMLNRVQQIIDDSSLIDIIDSDSNTIDEIIASENEITIIQADFDRSELDIIMFLFSKLIYKHSLQKKDNLILVFEEAHRYINEDESIDYKLGNFYIERLAREGRKFGIGLVISSQRPSELSRTVLSQCNSYIIHRITNRNDLDFISKTLSADNFDLLKIIPGLERQYAVLNGEGFAFADIVKIATAEPTPDSKDPEVINDWI